MTYKQLTPGQRYAIAAMLRRGHSQKEIAETVGVSPATICREVRRNSTARTYSPRAAQEMADIRKERLRRNRVVPDWVWARVRARWSPEQVSGALRAEGVRVSHQAIYGMIRADKAPGGDLSSSAATGSSTDAGRSGPPRRETSRAGSASETGRRRPTGRASGTGRWTPSSGKGTEARY